MSAAIHTRYVNHSGAGKIRAWTKDGKGEMALRLPYPHDLRHSRQHAAAAKALAVRLGWAGLWIVGHNEDGSICAVRPIGLNPGDISNRVAAVDGEDFFIVEKNT